MFIILHREFWRNTKPPSKPPRTYNLLNANTQLNTKMVSKRARSKEESKTDLVQAISDKPRLDYSNGTSTKQRRTTSGAFTQLDPAQVRQLKEAFTLLDKDGNGTVSEDDLTEMLVSLGKDPSAKEVHDMLELMPQPLTFSSFLTGMSSLLCNVSSSGDLLSAFAAFESDNQQQQGERIHVDELKEMLVETGMSAQEVDTCFAPFLKAGGMQGDWFYYRDFVSMMRGGNLNDE